MINSNIYREIKTHSVGAQRTIAKLFLNNLYGISAAQKNYHGKHKRGFIYADTDSIYFNLRPEELIDVPVHPTDFWPSFLRPDR